MYSNEIKGEDYSHLFAVFVHNCSSGIINGSVAEIYKNPRPVNDIKPQRK
jgi:hypothetical protein